MVTLTFDFKSPEDAAEFLKRNFGDVEKPRAGLAKRASGARVLEGKPALAKAPKPEPQQYTREEARELLNQVLYEKGRDSVIEILSSLGATTIRDVQDFTAAAEKALSVLAS